MLALLLAACGGPSATAPIAPPAGDHDAAGPHEHDAPHGGEVKVVGDAHVEARLLPNGGMFWLSDAAGTPLGIEGWSGTAVVQHDGRTDTVALTTMGDHLHAPVTLTQGTPAVAVLSLVHDGKAASVRFETSKVGMAAHEHTALYGGVVQMFGHVHVEHVQVGDELRFWFSDEERKALTGGVTATAIDGGQRVPLTFDPVTGLAKGKAAGAGPREIGLDAQAMGFTFTLTWKP